MEQSPFKFKWMCTLYIDEKQSYLLFFRVTTAFKNTISYSPLLFIEWNANANQWYGFISWGTVQTGCQFNVIVCVFPQCFLCIHLFLFTIYVVQCTNKYVYILAAFASDRTNTWIGYFLSNQKSQRVLSLSLSFPFLCL